MTDYRCKMCGGKLNPVEGETEVVCEYCGVTNEIELPKPPVEEIAQKKRIKMPLVIGCVFIAAFAAVLSVVMNNSKTPEVAEISETLITSALTTEITVTETTTSLHTGDTVYFGTYEQDNNYSNGSEKLAWTVLDVRDNKALIITKNGIDSVAYNNQYVSTTWANCFLRKWLNNNFYNAAFSSVEKAKIQPTTLKNNDNREYKTNGGVDTQDKVFALSICEAEMYFSSDDSRSCLPTDYALANGASENTYEELIEIGDTPAVASKYAGHCWWWLRSPGCKNDNASYIFADGEIGDYGRNVNRNYVCVRPAMWIEIG